MRSFNKIWRFLAVGFVLVFSGKVSKASLFTAYVKTIAEVEIRNTQDLKQDLQGEIAILTKVRALTRLLPSFSPSWFSTASFLVLPEPKMVSIRIPLRSNFSYSSSHHFFSTGPIRAPGTL